MAYKDSTLRFGGYNLTQWVKNLLIANFAVFILKLAVPGIVDILGFAPDAVLYRPWTLITYMFVHANFFHVLFNMMALFFFGPPLEERWGSKAFVRFYFISGLGGAALSFLFAYHS